MKKYGFGVDVGGTTCKIGLFDVEGKMLEKWEIPTDTSEKGKYIIAGIAASLKGKMQEKDIDREEVLGIGVGIPGPVNDKGIVVFCANLGWKMVAIEEELSKAMDGIPVKAGNDANVAALGEMWQGGAKGYENVVMVTLGTGVGGGIIVDGKVIAGATGTGGEIGHITVNTRETGVCGCGRKGCLEYYCSATGIARLAGKYLATDHEASQLDGKESVTAKDVFDAYKEEDSLARAIVEEFSTVLGMGLGIISAVVDPQIFVIGGGVSKAGQVLIDVVQEKYKTAALGSCADTAFALATLGNDAGMYGCMRLLMN